MESNHYIVDMLKYFNVVSRKEDGLLRTDRKEEDVDLIIARRKYELLLKNGVLGKLDDLNKVLFQKRLKILQKSEVGKKILSQFNSETYKINGWFLKEGMPGYFRYLNQMLDGLMELYSAEAMKDAALMVGWRKFNADFAADSNKLMAAAGKLMTDDLMAQENLQAQRQRQLEDELKKDLEPQKTIPEQHEIPEAEPVRTPADKQTNAYTTTLTQGEVGVNVDTRIGVTGAGSNGASGNNRRLENEHKKVSSFGNMGKDQKEAKEENKKDEYNKGGPIQELGIGW